MQIPDFTSYSDEDLQETRTAILSEVERRDRLILIPSHIAELVARYESDGGNRSDLMPALESPAEVPGD